MPIPEPINFDDERRRAIISTVHDKLTTQQSLVDGTISKGKGSIPVPEGDWGYSSSMAGQQQGNSLDARAYYPL